MFHHLKKVVTTVYCTAVLHILKEDVDFSSLLSVNKFIGQTTSTLSLSLLAITDD